MNIRKAVIRLRAGQGALPLQRFVDLDGREKTACRSSWKRCSAGVEEICLVVRSGSRQAYATRPASWSAHWRRRAARTAGYGEALAGGRFVGTSRSCDLVATTSTSAGGPGGGSAQVVEQRTARPRATPAVQATREGMLKYYGVVGGRPCPASATCTRSSRAEERPRPPRPNRSWQCRALRGHYLCLFGMRVLTPA